MFSKLRERKKRVKSGCDWRHFLCFHSFSQLCCSHWEVLLSIFGPGNRPDRLKRLGGWCNGSAKVPGFVSKTC